MNSTNFPTDPTPPLADIFMIKKQAMFALFAQEHINNPLVLSAFKTIPRELFVLPGNVLNAYDNAALPIGFGQTISQPLMIAIALAALDAKTTDHVLDIGTGSGYQAALLAHFVSHVTTIETIPELSHRAHSAVRQCGLDSKCTFIIADGSYGAEQYGPFDAIIVGAAAPSPPQPLLDQLSDTGRLIIPLTRDSINDELVAIERSGKRWEEHDICPCRFVPLIGRYGYGNAPDKPLPPPREA